MESRLKSAADWRALDILVEQSQCFKREGNRIGEVVMGWISEELGDNF